ncbi:hypothetical protein PRJBM_00188 [Bartonella henselae]|nr:hypothetical protein Q654_00541 [Bartonella henselae JK 50]ETS10766.1 hypothetical protein Q655_00489 [Bartonella henselae JK 51]CDO39583.1 hypothetical protein PRJBM_00188 [Bartonella henselae]CUH90157.1 hypothetical protein BM1374164_00188 [Bartonella henselae]
MKTTEEFKRLKRMSFITELRVEDNFVNTMSLDFI